MSLSASIVTYNSAKDIGGALSSLLACGVDDIAVTVVDNASTDGTAALVARDFPSVRLLCLPQNVGFGAGHNIALKEIGLDRANAKNYHASGVFHSPGNLSTYHAFVNPDITVPEGQIAKMLAYLDAHPDVVVLTPKMLNADGTEQFLPKRYPTLRYLIGSRFEDKSSLCRRWRHEYTRQDEDIRKPVEIDFCTGSFMLCRTAALLACGGFDERYFLHFEDADLTRQMKRYGKTMYVPDVSILHGWRRENAGNGKIFRIALASMCKYFWKWK